MTPPLSELKQIDYHLVADTAMLAGEIMLIAGAETHRVEDTINRILKTTHFARCDAFVVTTGIMLTIEDWRIGTISLNRRVGEKQTNLGNIEKVNAISRKYCNGELTLKETFHQLKHMQSVSYPDWLTYLSMIMCASCFALILGGGFLEFLIAGLNGIFIIAGRIVNRKLELNSFVMNMFASYLIAFASALIQLLFLPDLLLEPLIAGSVMVLLPGMAMTTGIRDTLEGDFMSGGARMIEAFVIAASVGVGIGVGIASCHLFFSLF
ncbi:MAG: threonine/serine exporter family protein [Lachnospiraceae bacterium]|nr:threonine/serine exporter family protein [Robinsoniella sp.]MDY3765270.1 threonine/serine exporter family protein [Lachnospiraceae bacterium]